MKYNDYGVVWEDGIERCTDNADEYDYEKDDCRKEKLERNTEE